MENSSVHYVDKYIRDPRHRLTVSVFGVGGTGSFLLSKLARLDIAMKTLYGYPGIHVVAFDPDIIEQHNYVRSTFSPSDNESPKASTIVTRINRYYGLKWEGIDRKFDRKTDSATNIVFLCVDELEARKDIMKSILQKSSYHDAEFHYCIDSGNNKDHGQIIISSNPKKKTKALSESDRPYLPFMWKLFPEVKDDFKPSCSMEESLSKQNVFINEAMALYSAEVLKNLLINPRLNYNAVFVNLTNLATSNTFLI